VVWKLDRLGRDLKHLVNTVQDLSNRGIGLRVLAGQGAQIDTTTPTGKLIFGIFASLAEFERELIRERTLAGRAAARARGRSGGRKFALSKAKSVSLKPPWPNATHLFPNYARNSELNPSRSTATSIPTGTFATTETAPSTLSVGSDTLPEQTPLCSLVLPVSDSPTDFTKGSTAQGFPVMLVG